MNVWEYLKKVKSSRLIIGVVAAAVLLCAGYLIGRMQRSAVVRPSRDKIDVPVLQAEQGKIDLNTATQAELMTLPGIGQKTAEAIIEYRDAVGGLLSVDELLSIKGFGEKKLEAIRPLVTISAQ